MLRTFSAVRQTPRRRRQSRTICLQQCRKRKRPKQASRRSLFQNSGSTFSTPASHSHQVSPLASVLPPPPSPLPPVPQPLCGDVRRNVAQNGRHVRQHPSAPLSRAQRRKPPVAATCAQAERQGSRACAAAGIAARSRGGARCAGYATPGGAVGSGAGSCCARPDARASSLTLRYEDHFWPTLLLSDALRPSVSAWAAGRLRLTTEYLRCEQSHVFSL